MTHWHASVLPMPRAPSSRSYGNQRLFELFEFGNPERIPKSSGSGVRSEGLFSVGIRSEVVQFGRSENPEFPNPENIDLLS